MKSSGRNEVEIVSTGEKRFGREILYTDKSGVERRYTWDDAIRDGIITNLQLVINYFDADLIQSVEDDEEQEDEDEEKKEDSNIIVRNQKRKRSHTIFQSQ